MEINMKKVHTIKDLTISSLVLITGAGLFFLNKGLGICIGVCGLAMYLIYKSGYKKDGKGIVFSFRSEDLCKVCKVSLQDFLEGRDTVPIIKKGHEGGSVRLDLYYNKVICKAYAQLHDFCNYAYEPVTGLVELNVKQTETMISLLN